MPDLRANDVPARSSNDVPASTLIDPSGWSLIELLGPAIVTPVSATVTENSPFGLVNLPDKGGSAFVPFLMSPGLCSGPPSSAVSGTILATRDGCVATAA